METLFPFEDPARRCLRVEEWPETDQQAWAAALQPGDILDGTVGAAFHWRPQTREKHRKGYGRWLTFLARSGRLEANQPPGARVTPEAVRAYLEELQAALAPGTICGRLAELLAAVRAMEPDRDWSWLRRVVRRLERRIVPTRVKLERLRDPGEIVARAYAIMDGIRAAPPGRWSHTRYRDALVLALLAQCPIRLGNLVAIELGRHLLRGADGYRLAFAPDETKTRHAFAAPLPASLTPYLDHYLEAVRPTLIGQKESERLWIKQDGRPMSGKNMHFSITGATRRAFGVPINPHLFRDIAASFVAVHDPKHIGIAAPILGHSDPRTTERHYIQAKQLTAGRRYRSSVDALRARLPDRRSRKREP